MADYRSNLVISVDSKGVVTGIANLKKLETQTQKTRTATENFGKTNDKVYGGLTSRASQVKTVGRDLTRYLTLPLTLAAGAGIKFATDLNSGLAQVQTLIPDTGNRIYELRDVVKDLSIEFGRSFTDLNEGLYQTISAFQDGTETVGRFRAAVQAAVAGGSTTKEAVSLLAAVTKAYGDTTAEATQKVSDLAFETVRLGITTFPQLAQGIQIATDSASRLGVSQEELFTVFATTTGVIGDASEVATKFRSATASLLNPTEDLKDLFLELGVSSGKALIQQRGLIGAFEAIYNYSQDGGGPGGPLQKYIKRIEGITLVSRLASQQLTEFKEKFKEMNDASDATYRASLQVIEGINKMGFELGQTQQKLIVMSVDLGEKLLPILIDVTDRFGKMAERFTELKDSTQQLIIEFGILVAFVGPVLNFVGSVAKFFVVLGPGIKSILVGLGKVIAKFKILIGFIQTDGFLAVLKAFPVALGGAMTGGAVAVGVLFAAMLKVSEQYVETARNADSLVEVLDTIKEKTEDQTLAVYEETLARQRNKIALLEESEARILASAKMANGFNIGDTTSIITRIELEKEKLVELEAAYNAFFGRITNTFEEEMNDLKRPDNLPTWQQVFMDVTKVDKTLFQFLSNSGQEAARLYLQGFKDTFEAEKAEADQFFLPFDDMELYQKEFDAIYATIKSLLSETNINDPFTMQSNSIQALLSRLKELRSILDGTGIAAPLKETRKEVNLFFEGMKELAISENIYKIRDGLGVAGDRVEYWESQLDTANQTLNDMIRAGGYTADQIQTMTDRIVLYTNAIKDAEKETGVLWENWDTALKEFLSDKFVELFNWPAEMADAFADFGVSAVITGINLLEESFYNLGRAIGDASKEGYDYNNMLRDLGQSLMEILPDLMIQAGLMFLTENPPLGIALIAAGMTGKFTSGVVQGIIDSNNANGNVYSGGNIIPFRDGGAFTNSIVDSPTLFPFAEGTGLMGEAGPEAIMPLTRTATGELGVRAEGGAVNVYIQNNTGAEVTTQETNGPNGRELQVVIGNVVKGQIANGAYDQPMKSRYGIKSKGVA